MIVFEVMRNFVEWLSKNHAHETKESLGADMSVVHCRLFASANMPRSIRNDFSKRKRELEEALKAYNSRVAEEKQNVPSQLQLQPVIPTKQSQDLTAAGSGETETAKPEELHLSGCGSSKFNVVSCPPSNSGILFGQILKS
ncbi:Protein of unknown function [Cotesia congregata]|uniref:Uncharacterized protein n=1 Tax=Cotesia congregata TaxID=51543 RepID=A0A8J2ED50_COTCN|nr:Protein of unknown function [Cotesia congregata]